MTTTFRFGDGARRIVTTLRVPGEIRFRVNPPLPPTEGEAKFYLILTVQTGETRLPKDSQVVVLKRGRGGNVIELSGHGGKKRPPEFAPLRPKPSPTDEYTLIVSSGAVRLTSHGVGLGAATGLTFLKPADGTELQVVWGTREETKDNLFLPDGTVITALSGFEFPGEAPAPPPPQPPPVVVEPPPVVPPVIPPIVVPPVIPPVQPPTVPPGDDAKAVLIAEVKASLLKYLNAAGVVDDRILLLLGALTAGSAVDVSTFLFTYAQTHPNEALQVLVLQALFAQIHK